MRENDSKNAGRTSRIFFLNFPDLFFALNPKGKPKSNPKDNPKCNPKGNLKGNPKGNSKKKP